MSRAAFSILLLAAVAGAQDLVPKAAPQKGPIAVTNCTLHPIDGPTLQNAWILFDKGRIVKLGTGDGAFDNGVEIHDAKGRHVYPGFIAPYTSLGLVEINAVRASVDMREVGELKPEARAAVAVNPDSTLIPVTRSNGVLTFMTFPRGGAIPGRASVMSTDGWTWEDMAIRADAGLDLRQGFLGGLSNTRVVFKVNVEETVLCKRGGAASRPRSGARSASNAFARRSSPRRRMSMPRRPNPARRPTCAGRRCDRYWQAIGPCSSSPTTTRRSFRRSISRTVSR